MSDPIPTDRIKLHRNKKNEPYKLVFLICLAILAGTGYQLYVSLDWTLICDGDDYLRISEGDFDVNITRRYRVIPPMIARILAYPFEYITAILWSHRSGSEWTIRFCFFLENLTTMTFAGMLIYFICRSYRATVLSALLATVAVLLSRWGSWFTVVPNSDAIYLLIVACVIWGVKSEKKWPLVFAIFIGPFAKESFIFVAPIILLFGRPVIKLPLQIMLFALSGTIVFSFRYWLDSTYQVEYSDSLKNAFEHFENLAFTYNRMVSLRGLGELFGVWGFFSIVIIMGFLGGKIARKSWLPQIDWPLIYLIPCMLLHAVISTEVSRMLYFASPVFAVSFALILDKHPYFSRFREWILKLD